MSRYTLVVEPVTLPVVVVHGGAGAYLKTTTAEQRAKRAGTLKRVVERAASELHAHGARAGVLEAIAQLETDPSFNAGFGSRLQRDGKARLSASLMDGKRTRISAVYNSTGYRHPSRLADALQSRGDRNLDATGAAALRAELGIAEEDTRSASALDRWKGLLETGQQVDREGAIGDATAQDAMVAQQEQLPVPDDLDEALPPESDRYGTVGAVACDSSGAIWACTSTGGRGHETAGRISDSPTPAGNYACPLVAISATGFGEQILDMNVAGRIATRMLDGASLARALERTFDEVAELGGLFGVIAVSRDGHAGYAYTTEACGVAWVDGSNQVHLDPHGRG